MKKSSVLAWAAGALALVLGAGTAWWQATHPTVPDLPSGTTAVVPASPGAELLQRLAAGSLPAPAGETSLLLPGKQQLIIVNFWATWCPPCVEEIPQLNSLALDAAFAQQARVVGIAIDNPSNVNAFLPKNPVNYTVGLAGLDGGNWMRAMGNSSGGLPFTVILDARGTQLYSKTGKTSASELRGAVAAIVNSASKTANNTKP